MCDSKSHHGGLILVVFLNCSRDCGDVVLMVVMEGRHVTPDNQNVSITEAEDETVNQINCYKLLLVSLLGCFGFFFLQGAKSQISFYLCFQTSDSSPV